MLLAEFVSLGRRVNLLSSSPGVHSLCYMSFFIPKWFTCVSLRFVFVCPFVFVMISSSSSAVL